MSGLIRVEYHGAGWSQLNLSLRLATYILEEGKARGARRVFDECGLVICCDEAWFPPPGMVTYRLSAVDHDWQVDIHFVKNEKKGQVPSTPHLSTKVVTFQGEQRKFVRAEVTNRDGYDKALTLLRMFGPEELFSG